MQNFSDEMKIVNSILAVYYSVPLGSGRPEHKKAIKPVRGKL